MKNPTDNNAAEILRELPSVDVVSRTIIAQKILPETGTKYLTTLIRAAVETLRQNLQEKIATGDMINLSRSDLLAEAEKHLEKLWQRERNSGLQKVINATGVIVHTNLGRAPLSVKAVRAVAEKAAGYCTLEYNLETGKRGRRGGRAERLLAEITGAEAAVIVNNCAGAAFLVLTALAKNGEVVISRGELVEIGGDFRVPDVMEQSGAILREVGTTNRTKVSDYEQAITESTRMILRVHPSNYRIVGFTAMPELSKLAELAREKNILLYEDAGSGAICDLSKFGLTDEPIISDSLKAGADVVTFSGDKLLGGIQSGLIVGKKEIIEKVRRHPLYRALRVDKLAYAALEATLEAFRRETALEEIPVLKMISTSSEELMIRIGKFADKLRENLTYDADLHFEIIEGNSVIGGGSAPLVQPATTLLAVTHRQLSVEQLEHRLRLSDPPIITRILEDKVLIDLRTVFEAQETEMLKILSAL